MFTGGECLELQRAFNVNDWELQSFLVFVVLLQGIFSLVIGTNLLGFQLPILSQVVGFGYLIFVPGSVILRALKLVGQSTVEMLLYTVGLSLAFLMMLGALLNVVGSFFALGLVSTLPLLIAMSVTVLTLTVIIYFRDRGQLKPVSIEAKSQFSLKMIAICLLPLVSIVGTYFMNSYGVNIILLLMLVVLSIIPIIVTFNKIPPKLYPVLIFSISLSLVYFNSLITSNLSGWDIHLEYYLANLVKTNSYWNPSLPSNYNAMLSVVMIGPIFSDLGGLSLVWVFKIIYPLLFSFVPVAIYEMLRKRINGQVAFLSSFFFMATYVFYSEMVQLARQEIASIFLVLLFFLIIDGKLKSTKSQILFMIFGIALIVSHYALTYLFLFSVISVWLITVFLQNKSIQMFGARATTEIKKLKIRKLQEPSKPKPAGPVEPVFVPAILISCLVLVTFAWYLFIANGTSLSALSGVLNNIFGSSSGGLFNPSTSQGLSQIANLPILPLHQANEILYLALQLFIIVGFAILIFRAQVSNLSRTYMAFAFVSLIIALACISLPYFSNALNASRLYLFTLIFLAPLSIIGGSFLIQALGKTMKIKVNSKTALKIVAGLLGLFLLFNSGFVYEVTKNDPTMMALNNSVDYPRFSNGEVQAAQWIANQVGTESANVSVYGDIYGSLLLSEFFGHVETFWSFTNSVANNSIIYIYFRSVNVKGEVMSTYPSGSYVNIQNSSFGRIVAQAVKVYESSSGDAQVYRLSTLHLPFASTLNFQSGNLNNWNVTYGKLYTGNQTTFNGAEYSIQNIADGSNENLYHHALDSTTNPMDMREYVYINSTTVPSTNGDYYEVGGFSANASGNFGDGGIFVFNVAGTLYWGMYYRNLSSVTGFSYSVSSNAVSIGWNCVELKHFTGTFNSTNGEEELYLNGEPIIDVKVSNSDRTPANVVIGGSQKVAKLTDTWNYYIGDVAVSSSYIGPIQ
jgi:uncharacterized membrane protein